MRRSGGTPSAVLIVFALLRVTALGFASDSPNPAEDHGFPERENQIDSIRRTVEWFDKYLKGAATSQASAPIGQ